MKTRMMPASIWLALIAFGGVNTGLSEQDRAVLSPVAITNVGGWHIAVSMPTNCFAASSPIPITLQISNCTGVKADVAITEIASDGELSILSPGFGHFEISSTNTATLPVKRSLNPNGVLMGNSRGGTVNPRENLSLNYDLRSLYDFPASGVFEVSFAGKLPLLTGSDGESAFKTSSLKIEIRTR